MYPYHPDAAPGCPGVGSKPFSRRIEVVNPNVIAARPWAIGQFDPALDSPDTQALVLWPDQQHPLGLLYMGTRREPDNLPFGILRLLATDMAIPNRAQVPDTLRIHNFGWLMIHATGKTLRGHWLDGLYTRESGILADARLWARLEQEYGKRLGGWWPVLSKVFEASGRYPLPTLSRTTTPRVWIF